ncbi:hypothetical protein TNCV_4618321 [Trichonephila clavipes]|nr:hypothetical protein TNCV_4618321 [Trichonephila clavipes]
MDFVILSFGQERRMTRLLRATALSQRKDFEDPREGINLACISRFTQWIFSGTRIQTHDSTEDMRLDSGFRYPHDQAGWALLESLQL